MSLCLLHVADFARLATVGGGPVLIGLRNVPHSTDRVCWCLLCRYVAPVPDANATESWMENVKLTWSEVIGPKFDDDMNPAAMQVRGELVHIHHPGGNPGANLESISHRCRPILVAFVLELSKETIDLSLGCLQGGVKWEPLRRLVRGCPEGVLLEWKWGPLPPDLSISRRSSQYRLAARSAPPHSLRA